MDSVTGSYWYCCCDQIPYFYNRFTRWVITLIGFAGFICLLPVITLINPPETCTIYDPFMQDFMCYLLGLLYMMFACITLIILVGLITVCVKFIINYNHSVSNVELLNVNLEPYGSIDHHNELIINV